MQQIRKAKGERALRSLRNRRKFNISVYSHFILFYFFFEEDQDFDSSEFQNKQMKRSSTYRHRIKTTIEENPHRGHSEREGANPFGPSQSEGERKKKGEDFYYGYLT